MFCSKFSFFSAMKFPWKANMHYHRLKGSKTVTYRNWRCKHLGRKLSRNQRDQCRQIIILKKTLVPVCLSESDSQCSGRQCIRGKKFCFSNILPWMNPYPLNTISRSKDWSRNVSYEKKDKPMRVLLPW